MDTKKQLALAAGASLGLVALYRWQRRSKKAAPRRSKAAPRAGPGGRADLEPDLGGGPRRGWKHGAHFSVTFDYSGAAFKTQLRDSLQRTGLARRVARHPRPRAQRAQERRRPDGRRDDEAPPRRAGVVGLRGALRAARVGRDPAFGAGANADEAGEDAAAKAAYNADYVNQLFALGDEAPGGRGLDFLLIANCYSLLNFSAAGILDECEKRGVAVVIGGPFSSGILATGPDPPRGTAMYNYRPASDDVRATARRIEAICKRHGVPSSRRSSSAGPPAVASVIPGGKSPAEVRSNVASMRRPIPGALWADLRAAGLLPPHIRAP
ncbi:D-arabinose 1-dehydrogenase [Aureococcus anophagefferens]|nr:D-arabinose 1-dehydrogenase [Aureococcus anophagefferens]